MQFLTAMHLILFLLVNLLIFKRIIKKLNEFAPLNYPVVKIPPVTIVIKNITNFESSLIVKLKKGLELS